MQRILHLDVDEVAALLKEVFPLRDASETEGHDFAEPASYRGGAGQTYEVEHERIFDPIAANSTLLRRIGAAITYHIGAVGQGPSASFILIPAGLTRGSIFLSERNAAHLSQRLSSSVALHCT